jgi:hypothetical protein
MKTLLRLVFHLEGIILLLDCLPLPQTYVCETSPAHKELGLRPAGRGQGSDWMRT